VGDDMKHQKDEWFFLYILPAFFLGLSGYSLYMLEFDAISLMMATPFALLAIAFHMKHRKNLKVVTLDKPGNSLNFEKCVAVIKEQNWEIIELNRDTKILAHTNGSWRSWGELVSIDFLSQEIRINSRPSPYKKASIATWGKSNENIQVIKKALQCN
jgi:hypothetical protein